jgi:hypothetical protein
LAGIRSTLFALAEAARLALRQKLVAQTAGWLAAALDGVKPVTIHRANSCMLDFAISPVRDGAFDVMEEQKRERTVA